MNLYDVIHAVITKRNTEAPPLNVTAAKVNRTKMYNEDRTN